MLADVSRVASQLREDTFAVALTRRREEIQQHLLAAGTVTIREGGREFTIRLKTTAEREGPEPAPR